MRIRQQRSKTLIFIVLFILLLLVSVISIYMWAEKQTSEKSSSKTSEDSNISRQDLKVNAENDNPAATQTGVTDVTTDNNSPAAGAFPTTQPNLKISLLSIKQQDNNLVVDNVISPTITTGECTIRVTRGSERLAEREFKTSGTSCVDPFIGIGNIPSGDVSVTILVQVGNNVANSTKLYTVK